MDLFSLEGGFFTCSKKIRLKDLTTKVGRCKLDPSLKAHAFQILIVKRIDGAFNLKPGFLSLRPYT